LLRGKGSLRDRQGDDDDEEAEDIDDIKRERSQPHRTNSPVEAFCNSLRCYRDESIIKALATIGDELLA
jgi:hypothetical protein